MPLVGLGTYLLNNDQAAKSVGHALANGYRLIDTAEFYGNHAGIAQGIEASGVKRSDFFITDKVSPGGHFGVCSKSADDIFATLKKNLSLLKTEYVDLFLIHYPGATTEERLEQWGAMISLVEQGLTKHIGVSNYSEAHLEEIKAAGLRAPEVNQIEIHPLALQSSLVAYLRENNISITA